MLSTIQLPRVFSFKDNGTTIELADPNPMFSPEDVLHFYANSYPILTTAKIGQAQIINDTLQYQLETTLGTKG